MDTEEDGWTEYSGKKDNIPTRWHRNMAPLEATVPVWEIRNIFAEQMQLHNMHEANEVKHKFYWLS